MADRPYIWQMIREAIHALDGKAAYREIKEYVWQKYGDVNENTLNAQIIVCTVNHDSRVHYPENEKPRVANERYDFLYSVGRGQVVLYEPEKHGQWEIRQGEGGKLRVARVDEVAIEEIDETEATEELLEALSFPLEAHLRDFIAQNIEAIKVNGEHLQLYTDEHGHDGVEFNTDVGRIDILTVDDNGNFVVFELKLGRGADAAVGQILRYMGWVKRVLAGSERKVSGVIVSQKAGDKLRYAVSAVPNLWVFEYQVQFNISPVDLS